MQGRGNANARFTGQAMHYAKRNMAAIILAILFLAGILFATMLLDSTDNSVKDFLIRLADGFAQKKISQGIKENFLSSLTSSMVFIGFLLIAGFCAVGQPVILILPLFRGLGIGFSVASLYSRYGSSAIGFALIYMMCTIISVITMLMFATDALKMSNTLFSAMYANAGAAASRGSAYPLGVYITKFIIYSLVCVFSATLESVLYSVFANYIVLV